MLSLGKILTPVGHLIWCDPYPVHVFFFSCSLLKMLTLLFETVKEVKLYFSLSASLTLPFLDPSSFCPVVL